ncbi:MAG: autotransporter outer membrane beta-barrel domain-containing protein [Planctomycetota bacterium]
MQASGAADIKLIVKGAASQSVNLFELQDSNGAVLSSVNEDGHFGIGVAPNSKYRSYHSWIFTSDPGEAKTSIYGFVRSSVATSHALSAIGGYAQTNHPSGVVADIAAFRFLMYHSNAPTVSTSQGMYVSTLLLDNDGSAATVVNCYGVRTRLTTYGAHTGNPTLTNYYGFYPAITLGETTATSVYAIDIPTPTKTAGGSVTNLYGIRMGDINIGGTLNFAIQTNAGNIVFNEGGDADTDFRVESDSQANMLFVDAGFDSVLINGSADLSSTMGITTTAAADKGLVIKGSASQTANLQEWQDSSGTILNRIEKDGDMTIKDGQGIQWTDFNSKHIGNTGAIRVQQTANMDGTYTVGYRVQGTQATTGKVSYGMDLYVTKSVADASSWNGLRMQTRVTADTGTQNVVRGMLNQVVLVGDGDITQCFALHGRVDNTGTGTIATGRACFIDANINSGGGAITNNYGIYIGNQNVGASYNSAITTNAGNIVFNEDGDANTDVRIETDAEPNFFFIDGGSEWLRVGDWDTNYVEIDKAGDMTFVGGGGLAFAEIYASDVADTITISSSGQANKVQVTSFAVDGVSNNMTPDHTNDHITVTKAGMYLATISISVTSTGGSAYQIAFSLYKNNGATEFVNVHTHRNLSGGGGDTGSMSLSGIVDLAVNDTIEVWTWNETNTNDIIIDDITLSLVMVGGT